MDEQKISPEQLKVLQEKIKNMSPEELKEFQKKQCIFCQIVSGRIQAKKIYEDENVVSILDINPANPGHILLLTKEHYSIMPQIPDDDIAHIFMIAKSLSNSMLRSIDAHGTNIIVANGIAAGQRAQHFMVHIIPRKENDGVNFVLPQKTIEHAEIEQIGNKILAALSGGAEKAQEPETIISEIPKKLPEKKPEVNKPNKKPDAQEKPQAKTGIDLDDIGRLLGAK